MAKVDYPNWHDSENAWKDHLQALNNELAWLRTSSDPREMERVKEVEEQIKLNGGTVPAKPRAKAAAGAE